MNTNTTTAIKKAKKLAADRLDSSFLRWAIAQTGAEWKVNEHNADKVELVNAKGLVLIQVLSWGELHLAGALLSLVPKWRKAFPFFVMTRDYNAKGDCIKGRRVFRTRDDQARYIARTPKCVTFFN